MNKNRYVSLNEEREKISNYHQITYRICFPVFIINFADTLSKYPLSGPYLHGWPKSPRISYLNLLRVIRVLCNPNCVFKSIFDRYQPDRNPIFYLNLYWTVIGLTCRNLAFYLNLYWAVTHST